MRYFYSALTLISITLLSLFSAGQAMALDAEYSGFARIIAGIHDDKGIRYNNYRDELSFEQDSLAGLQVQLNVNDKLSATVLGIVNSNADIDSDIEWFYVRYTPIKALTFKVGQMQTPFYNKSDVLDVGYAYPWLVAPTELYNDFVFKRFQGVDARYSFNVGDANINLETYYGIFDDNLVANGYEVPAKVDRLNGYIGEVRFNSWQFRASYHYGDAKVTMDALDELAGSLRLLGFDLSADSINTDIEADFYQMGLSYDAPAYFVLAEAAYIDPNTRLFPKISSYYMTYGYYFQNMTFLLTYAQRKDDLSAPVNEIPIATAPPSAGSSSTDIIYYNYQGIYGARSDDDLTSWTLGLRWDVYRNTALKAELKNISSEHSNAASFKAKEESQEFDKELNILMLGLEWVF